MGDQSPMCSHKISDYSYGTIFAAESPREATPFTLVDLFCGCGGYSWGFLFPEDGVARWKILRGLDIDRNAVATFNRNIGTSIARVADLNQEDPRCHLDELKLKPGQLSCLHASPPCAAYSVNNRRNGHGKDFRFRIALDWVEIFRPKIVTIENVLRLQEWEEEIRARLGLLDYTVGVFVLNSVNYGVPQFRKRLYYVGYHESLGVSPSTPPPAYGAPDRLNPGQKPWATVGQAIGDLPPRKAGQGPDCFTSRLDPRNPDVCARLGAYAALLRPPRGSRVENHRARVLNELMQRRVTALRPGQAIADLPKELQPRMGFRGAYGRLDSNLPAKTITTGVRGPSHGPFFHYGQDRLITIREAARLQSFPDTFAFEGGLESQARQVGNAVPPLLAAELRRQFSRVLEATVALDSLTGPLTASSMSAAICSACLPTSRSS